MAVVEGAQGTAATLGILSARRIVAMRDGLAELEPDAAPLTLLLRKMKKKAVIAPKYEWLEHDRMTDFSAVNNGAGYSSSATSIVVDDGSLFTANMLAVVDRTGEIIRVSSVSTNTLTVVRSIGTTAGAAMVDNDPITVLATAHPENASAPAARANPETTDFNYTQIQYDTFGASGTLIATKLYGSGMQIMSERARQRITDHQVGQEKTFFFGEKDETTSGNYPQRACGGFDEFITQTYDFGGAYSNTLAFDALETGMRYGSQKKALYCSRAVASNISLEAMDAVRVAPSDKTFGINIKVLTTPHGEVMVMKHNLLQGATYAKRAYLLDLGSLTYVFLRTRDTQLLEGLETNGVDGEIHGYLTEFGLERREAKKHQVWQNVSNG